MMGEIAALSEERNAMSATDPHYEDKRDRLTLKIPDARKGEKGGRQPESNRSGSV
jgi:hypothetical protein